MKHALAVAVGLMASLAMAQAPGSINFNARLTDTTGMPLVGGRAMTFRVFDQATGGSALWTENFGSVTFSAEGTASVELGSSTTLTPAILDGRRLFLEVQVDTQTLSPRIAVVSVPYAIRAGTAGLLGTLSPTDVQRRVTGACTTGQAVSAVNADGTVTCETLSAATGDITAVNVGNGITGGGTTGDVSIGLMACTAGQVLQHNGSNWACTTPTASGVIPGNTEIGVDVTLPPARLLVQGAAAVSGTGTLSASSGMTTGTGASTAFLSEVTVGDYIVCAGQTRKVTAVSSNTSLTVDFAWTADILVQPYTVQKGIATFRNSAGNPVVSIDAKGYLVHSTPWYANTGAWSDYRNSASVGAAGIWRNVPNRSVVYTKKLSSSALKITYQDTLGTLSAYYAGCEWQILIDGTSASFFSDADVERGGYGWAMSNAAHVAFAPTSVPAGSHTITVQSRGNRQAWGANPNTTECLMGWNTTGQFLLVEEIQ